MKKANFNAKLRAYAKTLSPTATEQDLVGKIYASFNNLFGVNNCVQIGSYPRFTATTPIHDLDILYILGAWDENNHTPATTLQNLFNLIQGQYVNPTTYTIQTSLQTHSVTVDFLEGKEVIFSVDIVPAYSYDKNEFGQDRYKVPEVIKIRSHQKRREFYATLQAENKNMSWINSDPRGYISVVSAVGINSDFRKTVKFVKRWKSNLCDADSDLKLKSFHIEQVVTRLFQQNPNIEIFDAISQFFYALPETVLVANRISDRANSHMFIDDYISEFSSNHLAKIRQARDGFLKKLEELEDGDTIENLIGIHFYVRSPKGNEAFLFDDRISVLTEPENDTFTASADITDKPGLILRALHSTGIIDSGRYLKFKSTKIQDCEYWWKVKNDDRSDQPRGEITKGRTMNFPEHTKFVGTHYVECYAIKNGVCVAQSRHNVVINNGGGGLVKIPR